MDPLRPARDPEWRQLLSLGEQLLEQPHASAQCNLIAVTVEKMLNCNASIWLARPYYPLPGEPEVSVIPDTPAPELVQQTLRSRQKMCQVSRSSQISVCDEGASPTLITLPIITLNNLLGVLQAERPPGSPFDNKEVDFLEGICAHAAVSMQISRQVVIKNWRNEQLSLVRSVSAQIANILDLDSLCQRVTRLIQQTFNYYYVAIFTLEDDNQRLSNRAWATQNSNLDCSPISTARVGDGIIGLVAKDGIELLAPDVRVEPYYHYIDTLPETLSEVSLPLKVENRVLGILDVQSDQLDGFHDTDMLVLRSLADNIALAIEGAGLYTRLQQRADQISAVFEVSHALNSILEPDDLLDEVVRLIRKRFGHPYVHLFTVHPGRRKIIYHTGSGVRAQKLRQNPIIYDLDDPFGIIPHVARTGKTFLANEVSKEPLYRPSELPPTNTQSELTIPLSFGGEVLGVLDLQSDQPYIFRESDRDLFEALGASIAIAIRNANLYRTEKWRHQVAESFKDVAGLISSNVALDTLLDTILRELERNLPCDASAIWLRDEPQPGSDFPAGELRLAAVHKVDPARMTSLIENEPVIREWFERTMASSQPTIRRPTDPYEPIGAALEYPVDYSSIAAPLRAGDQLLGAVTLVHHTAGRYGSEARSMTSTFANYAAVAIQNTRLFAQVQEQAWVSTVLLQVSETIQSITNIDELLSTITRLIPLLVGVNKCGLFVWEEAYQGFALRSWYGIDEPQSKIIFFEQKVPALAQLKALATPIFIQDAAAELNLPASSIPPDTGTLVMVPLWSRRTLLGAFLVSHQSDSQPGAAQPFNEQTLAILQGIAHQTAMVLENLRLTEASQEEAYVTAVLLQVAQAVVSHNEMSDIFDSIVHLMPILVGINGCIIYLWDKNREVFQPAKVLTDDHQQEEELLSLSYGINDFILLRSVYEQDRIFVCELSDPDTPPEKWPEILCIPSDPDMPPSNPDAANWLMGFPLSVKGEVFGVLVAKEIGTSSGVQPRRLEIINGIAQQTALAIMNERLKQERVDRERLQREFQLARQIQETFLPSSLPTFLNWEMDTRWQTARQVGGDFYDIFKLNDGRLGLVIADVSDKGMPAALYMTVTRTLIRANIQNNRSPTAVLEKVNRQLLLSAPHGMFITAIYAIIALETGEMVYANAGHNRPLLLRGATHQVETLMKGGTALGVLEKIHLQDHTVALEPGDILTFYTDGVTESFSPSGEAFGEERLEELIASIQGKTVCELLDQLDKALLFFRENAPPSDDVTLLAIQRLN